MIEDSKVKKNLNMYMEKPWDCAAGAETARGVAFTG
jgi:hypothetical protein